MFRSPVSQAQSWFLPPTWAYFPRVTLLDLMPHKTAPDAAPRSTTLFLSGSLFLCWEGTSLSVFPCKPAAKASPWVSEGPMSEQI